MFMHPKKKKFVRYLSVASAVLVILGILAVYVLPLQLLLS